MGFFRSAPSAGASNEKNKRDVFDRYHGKMTKKEMDWYLERTPLRNTEREYVKSVMDRFDEPHYSRGITREEFKRGLEEMEKDKRDSMDKRKIERVRQHFNF